jgi:hypothetical protein
LITIVLLVFAKQSSKPESFAGEAFSFFFQTDLPIKKNFFQKGLTFSCRLVILNKSAARKKPQTTEPRKNNSLKAK